MNRRQGYSLDDSEIEKPIEDTEPGLYVVETAPAYLENKGAERLKSGQLRRVESEKPGRGKLAEALELEQKQPEENDQSFGYVVWTLAYKIFAIFFPEAVKSHLSESGVCIGGFLVLALLIGSFIFFFNLQNTCQEVMLETSESDPDGAIYCNANYIAQTRTIGIDIHGYWSNDNEYDGIFGGPWQLLFKQYKEDWDNLKKKISQLISFTSQFVSNQENVEFFSILEQAYFFFEKVRGDNESEIQVQTDIDLETVFNNYVTTGFGLVNLSQPIKQNFNETGDARLNSGWQLLKTEPCRKPQHVLYSLSRQHLECGFFHTTNIPNAQHQVEGIHVSTISSAFYEKLIGYLYPGVSLEESYIGNKSFDIEWNFAQIFAYSYCNGKGSTACQQLLLNNSSSYKNQNKDQQDWPYMSVPDFIDVLNRNRTFIQSGDHEDDNLQKTVYINSTKQFGLYIGDEFIYRPNKNSNAIVEADQFLNVKGITVEYILVPQLTLATPELSETTYQGTTYFVCESCKERQKFVNARSQSESGIDISGMCMGSAYIYLHIYAVMFKPKLTPTGLPPPSHGINFLDSYLTTMLYRLDGKHSKFSFFTQDYSLKKLQGSFTYNTQLAQIQDLHCTAKEWRFNTSGPSSKEPFTLTTGVYSCLIKNCPGIFDLLGTAQANTQLVYIILQLLIITLYVCFLLPKISAQRRKENERWTNLMYESIAEIAENVAVNFKA